MGCGCGKRLLFGNYCPSCGRPVDKRSKAWIVFVVAIAAFTLLFAAQRLHAQEPTTGTQMRITVSPPQTCVGVGAVVVELSDLNSNPVANTPVKISTERERTMLTDNNGQVFLFEQQDWCEREISAEFEGNALLQSSRAGVTVPLQDPEELNARLIESLQQSVFKVVRGDTRGSAVVLRQEDGKTVLLTNLQFSRQMMVRSPSQRMMERSL
jgi:hypothetical protein